MLSSVFISGRLGPRIDEVSRYVELDEVIPGPTGKYKVHRIKVASPRGRGCAFLSAPEGALSIIKGRLACDENENLYVLLEIEETFPMKRQESPKK